MEARVCSMVVLFLCYFAFGAGYRTENFVVRGRIDARYAKQVGDLAEKYRSELAHKWLGYELPRWQQRCPIEVVLKRHAEGRTSFAFQQSFDGRSAPSDWDMMIAGPADRILDAVLPHEVTHTIFASHFGRPLPRWADEGACTTVEHISERQKNHRMLIEFLTNNRGIPFNQMFRMKEYPRDILPLYAQGYSLARYFIEQKGHRHFIKYLESGMGSQDWDRTTEQFYGFENLSDLQVSWIGWIKEGCPNAEKQREEKDAAMLASVDKRPERRPAAITQVKTSAANVRSRQAASKDGISQSWYQQQMQRTADDSNEQQQRLKADAEKFRDRPPSQDTQTRRAQIASPAKAPRRPRVVCSGGTCKIIR